MVCPGNVSGTCLDSGSDCVAYGPPLEACACQKGFAAETVAYYDLDIFGVFHFQCCPGAAAAGCDPPARHQQQVQVMLTVGVVFVCVGVIGALLCSLALRIQRRPLSMKPEDEQLLAPRRLGGKQ